MKGIWYIYNYDICNSQRHFQWPIFFQSCKFIFYMITQTLRLDVESIWNDSWIPRGRKEKLPLDPNIMKNGLKIWIISYNSPEIEGCWLGKETAGSGIPTMETSPIMVNWDSDSHHWESGQIDHCQWTTPQVPLVEQAHPPPRKICHKMDSLLGGVTFWRSKDFDQIYPPTKTRWQWNITIFNRRYILQWLVFYWSC